MRARAFTLIELLIAVGVIAILAALALPGLFAAQTRAKVARLASDLRAMRGALEAYAADHGGYPETDFGLGLLEPGAGPLRLTTPIAYLSAVPRSPFDEESLGHDPALPQHAFRNRWPLHISALAQGGAGARPDTVRPELDSNYIIDRMVYLFGSDSTLAAGRQYAGHWALKSVGPDGVDDRDELDPAVVSALRARVYDPTNGTRSRGDIMVYSDRHGLAGQDD